MISHQRGIHTVTDRRRTAALDVAQNGRTGVYAGRSLDLVGQILGADNAFRNNDDEMLLAGDLRLTHALQDVTLKGRRESPAAEPPAHRWQCPHSGQYNRHDGP